MTPKTTKLRNAILVALAVGGGSVTAAGSALAQDANPASTQSPTSLDTITVTGTRIRSQTMTASSPVAEISKEEFQFSGASKVEDLVNQYPQLALDFDNFLNNGSQGYATVDLRGMGANRTLALVNGRRIPKGLGETADISIVPPAIVQRVDILTGGASAVYGSDAIAGVVNFILDDQFEGVSVNFGYSAYQHNNDDRYIQGLMDQRDFDYPTGDSGFDGISKNVDVAIGGAFGESGHAVAWATWRKNDALLQGQRDYSSCALNPAGTACGGSPTADPANFYIVAPTSGLYTYVLPSASGWFVPDGPNIYNFAPVNYYQRPDTRFTAGSVIKYDVNEYFSPYLETMFVNRRSSTQIAPSGAFFTDIQVRCDTPVIGTMCADVGITDDEFTVYVAKRNVEGGPRITNEEATNYSITAGAGGNFFDGGWTWDASLQYARTSVKSENINDFITTRVRDALLGCPDGAFNGCLPYDVWTNSVTPEQAQALQGVGIVNYSTDMRVFNAYVTGDLGFSLPSAADRQASMVVGVETRSERFTRVADTNMATGNFTGLGGPTTNLSGGYDVDEVFMEANLPLVADAGPLNSLDLQLGYRYTDYSTSGDVNTWKAGLGASFLDNRFRFRAGFNRAIRGANINELFSDQQIALWPGTDPCAGATPEFTLAQCQRTGVTAAQYGNIAANAAAQNNQLIGGNVNLEPEIADTWTVGFAASPIDNLDLSVDYYDIKLENVIGTIGARTIINLCADGQDAVCGLIRRNAVTGDLFRGSDPETSGLVVNTNGNFGSRRYRGIDFTGRYAMDVGVGRLSASYVGSYVLERSFQPVPGDNSADYSCEGLVNTQCATPEWRHITSLRYGFDRYAVNLRWRYIGEMDYRDTDGNALTTDYFLRGRGKQSAFNYFDLSGSAQIGDKITWTAGVNNIADKAPPMVGSGLTPANANALGGYDQAGRYFFTSVAVTF
ncbi:TonB-dependent receptor domain-containing protein [Luteimonas deserti]|uniref:TonB-dependent receptor n=1 Tax=Luteimonas deserti TaxID=2752306 RepID=A0A7Z0TZ45_9GAMM|nr:TonB-dependent receptor [Luteimonas deserti]NYZ63560.1 TonB-dependent receptor [Luteimonas deserti]